MLRHMAGIFMDLVSTNGFVLKNDRDLCRFNERETSAV